jgi:hypothetical protein
MGWIALSKNNYMSVDPKMYAVSVDRTRDLQIFSLTLSQLSYPRTMIGFVDYH